MVSSNGHRYDTTQHKKQFLFHSFVLGYRKPTHGSHAHQGRAHAGVQAPPQAIAGDALAYDIEGRRVDAALGRLQAHLDQVEGVADDDGT